MRSPTWNAWSTGAFSAKNFAESKLEGKNAYIEFDSVAGLRGYYGRLLAYVYLQDGTDFTAELVKKGYARVYEEGECQKESEYLSYQNLAMSSNLGLWTCRIETTPSPSTEVVIWYAHYDAAGNDHYNLNDEYIVLKNTGTVSVNLVGWRLIDEANHIYHFPSYTLAPGDTITIHTGSGVNGQGHLYWGSGRAIWNNDHDTAYLYDSTGNLLDSVSW